MKNRLTEEIILFLSILKWFILSAVIGCIVGVVVSFFLRALNWSLDLNREFNYYFLLLPAALFLGSLLVKYFAPGASGYETENVIEAVHKRSGRVNAADVLIKIIATLVTFSGGGSVGKAGPSAEIGAGLSSVFAEFFKFSENDRRKLVICGISAGFAAVFGTPIGGAIFGIEVLFVGSLLYELLLPSLIAGFTAYQVSSAMGITYLHQTVNVMPVFREMFFIKVAFAGLFFGLCSLLLIELLNLTQGIAKMIKIWEPFKGIIGGLTLAGLTYIFSSQYLGLGMDTIENSLNGKPVAWYAFLLKSLFTSITLSFGGSGGIITPIFFIGAAAGSCFASFFNMNTAIFSAIGFVSLLAGAANTPIAAIIMAIELFGPKVAAYAAVACIISYLMTGYRSVFPSQILKTKKSASLKTEIGKEIG